MDNYRTARIIRIIFGIILLTVVTVGILLIASNMMSSSESNAKESKASQSSLLSTEADRSVRISVRGEITSDEQFRTYQIEITPNYRTYTAYTGYMSQEVDGIRLDNNIPAYEQFVAALNNAGYMNGVDLKDNTEGAKGACASGYVYEFQMLKGGKSVKKLWGSSCSRSNGTIKANISVITNLFYKQIPGVQAKIGKLWR